MNKLLLSICLAFLLISCCYATQDSLGTFKQGTCVELIQVCGTCTYNNLSSIVQPNATILYLNAVMTPMGSGLYNYTFCDTDLLGTYSINGIGNLDGTANAWAYDLYITLTGSEKITDGEGNLLIISIVMMIVFAAFFFILGLKVNSGLGSLAFVSISGIILFTSVMFTLTMVSDNLSNLGSAFAGYTTFLMIVKSIVSISVTVIVLYSLYKAYALWGLKRGLRIE